MYRVVTVTQPPLLPGGRCLSALPLTEERGDGEVRVHRLRPLVRLRRAFGGQDPGVDVQLLAGRPFSFGLELVGDGGPYPDPDASGATWTGVVLGAPAAGATLTLAPRGATAFVDAELDPGRLRPGWRGVRYAITCVWDAERGAEEVLVGGVEVE